MEWTHVRFEVRAFTPRDIASVVSAFRVVEKLDFFDCNFGEDHFKALQCALRHNNVLRTLRTNDAIPPWLHLPNVLHLQCCFANYDDFLLFVSHNTWCITINYTLKRPNYKQNKVHMKNMSAIFAYRAVYATVMHVLCIGKYRRHETPWRNLMPLIARRLYRTRGDTVWLALGQHMHRNAWQVAFKKRK